MAAAAACRCSSSSICCCCGARRRPRCATRASRLLKEAMGAGQRFRRHVPPLLFLIALTLMLVAIARPAAVVTLPSQHETVILAMDVSGSMRATDVKPSRIVAAQEAARAFVADQPKTDAHRRRLVRRHRIGRAVADAQPRGHPRRDRPLPAAARHRGRQRHPRLAEDDLSRCRIRSALVQSARATRRAQRPLDPSRAADKSAAASRCRRAPILPRRSSC